MCAAVVDEPEPVVVEDASRDPRFAANPFVAGPLDDLRFYASAPLVTPDGVPVGRLCVFDRSSRCLDEGQRGALATLAVRVMDLLELRLRSRQLEESLEELTAVRDELERSNRNLTRFAEQISHDLRTPLAAILVNAEVLAQSGDAVEPDLVPMVDGILRSGRRMDDLISKVLRTAHAGGDVDFAPTSLGEVLARVLEDLAPTLEESGAVVEVGQELPTVFGDAHLLYAVVLNLLTNAVKFARPGVAPHVCVTAARGPREWRVEITDDGVGLEDHDPEELFGRFARGDTSVDGTGIGLSTTRRIVEAHGGRIGLEPAASGGVTAWFALPD